jgi:hypothetical protein
MAALKRDLDGRRTAKIAAVIGLLGAVGVALGFVFDTERGFAAYLAAWCEVATVAIGGFALLLIGYAGNFRWFSTVRRIGELAAAAIAPVAVLVLPLLIGMRHVWPWVHPTPENVAAVQVKQAYLSTVFFVLRTVGYFVLLIIPAELLRRWSRRRDRHPEPQVPHGITVLPRERTLSAAMLPIVGLILTFGGFDYLMSLEPDWWSSAFGLYVITQTLQVGIAITIVLAWAGVATGAMPLRGAHFHAMGRMMHAFTILWAYIAFFQAMLIQIGNIPSEAKFYVDRLGDGWQVVTIMIVVCRFALPFVLLFSRKLKFHAGYMAAIAMLILFGNYLDMWWLVIPPIRSTPMVSWTDLSSICAIGGLTVAVATWRQRGTSLLPIGDPYLESGLAYESKY